MQEAHSFGWSINSDINIELFHVPEQFDCRTFSLQNLLFDAINSPLSTSLAPLTRHWLSLSRISHSSVYMVELYAFIVV